MKSLSHRRDWTAKEKLEFEDVAIDFINTHSFVDQEYNVFKKWIAGKYPFMDDVRDIIWSYVLSN